MSSSDARRFTLLQTYCQVSAIASIAVGCLVLYGWAFRIPVLLSIFPGYVTMKANTALGLALSGASLWLLLPGESPPRRRQIGHFLGSLTLVLGAATLVEYISGCNLAIDQLLFAEPAGAVATYSPGRMAPTSTTAFIAVGLSLMLLDGKTRRRQIASQLLALSAALTAMLALVGYLYHATALYRLFVSTQVALHTAVTFFLLGTAVFFVRPRQGIAGDLTGDAAGSVMARRFLPAVFLIPISLGWIGLRGELAGLYQTELNLALYSSTSILVLATLLWSNARKLNGEHEHRNRAEVALRELNADLERRVADRTSALEQHTAALAEQAALLDLAPDAIVVRDMENRILFWNRGAEAIYGWCEQEALGKDSTDLLKTEFFQTAEAVCADLLRQNHWEGDAIQYRRDGSRLIVASRSALQRDSNGTPVRILTINNNVTDSKEAASKLALLTERLSLATAVAKVGVWEWDLAHNTVLWDETMLGMYGFRPMDTIPYEMWSAAVLPDDRPQAEATLQTVVDGRGEASLEFRILRQDGAIRHISAVCRAIVDERTNVTRVIGVNVDVTERKEAEQALEQNRQNQLRFKDEFLSHVSHEVRSPLFAIMQFTTIMLDGLAGEITAEQRECEEIVLQNARQMQSMINDLLEVTRLENGKLAVEPEALHVNDAVSEIFNTLNGNASAAGVTLSCQIPERLPAVYADPIRVRQILTNLVENGIKFTPFGGSVQIRVLPLARDPEFLCIEISDTGIGIASKNLERIFERLYQTLDDCRPSNGLGLGLFICKQLVLLQGGEIWVESKVQAGSTFSFTLPVFSWKRLLLPLIRNDKWPKPSAALVIVTICRHDTRTPGYAREKWAREVRSLIRHCVMPNLDVLLPTRCGGGEEERFFVMAFADDHGASVLADRIRDQFEQSPHLTHGRQNVSVSHSMMKSAALNEIMPVDEMVAALVGTLEETMRSKSVPSISHRA
jgi:PAS domain S-box-containing protein